MAMAFQHQSKKKYFSPSLLQSRPDSGTGLGLSLSYDIIKAHAGEIKVETKGR